MALEQAFEKLKSAGDEVGQLLALCGLVEVSELDGSDFSVLDEWIAAFERLLERDPSFSSPEVQLQVYTALLVALIARKPDHPLLLACAQTTMQLLGAESDEHARIRAATVLMRYHTWNLDSEKAAAVARIMSSSQSESAVTPLERASWLLELAVNLSLEIKSEEALTAVNEACELFRSNGLGSIEGRLGHVRSLVLCTSGQHSARHDHIDTLRSLANSARPLDVSTLQRALSDDALMRGKSAPAVMHAQSAVELADKSGFRPLQLQSRVLLAAVLVENQRHDEAAACLNEVNDLAGTALRSIARDASLVGAALALRRRDTVSFRTALEAALSTSWEEGPTSLIFVLHPNLLSELCAEGLRMSIQPESIKRLIVRYRLAPVSPDVEAWPWPVKIYTLGGFSVLKEGAEIRFKRKTQKRPLELLQALIALGGTEVAVSTLTEALWPDGEGDAAYHAFENALYRLRQLLGAAGVLTLANGKLSLDPRQCWVDVWAFERRLAEPRGRDAQSARELETTLTLYRGHFLHQEGQPSWALAMRERLRDKFIRHVRGLARSYEQAQAWSEAAAIYQRGLELDNLAEDLYRGLMVCHREMGNHAEAVKAFRRCRELLSIVLGPSTCRADAGRVCGSQTGLIGSENMAALSAPVIRAFPEVLSRLSGPRLQNLR